MTQSYTSIGLDKLPAPLVVDETSAEDILAEMKAEMIKRRPDAEFALSLESEPVLIVLEACAYREYALRQRINHAAKSVMLAYATGSNLDHLSALFGIERADDESDQRLRHRTQIALEGFTTAGSVGAYEFHALSSSSNVRDVCVESPAPGEVKISILTNPSEDPAKDQETLDAVASAVNDVDVRPLTDHVTVQIAAITNYSVRARLKINSGPVGAVVYQEALKALNDYVGSRYKLGQDITLSGIYAAAHQEGVHSVVLVTPSADITVGPSEAAFCTDVELTFEVQDG